MLRLLLFLLGSATLGVLIWHIGPARIMEAAAGLGPAAILVILLPSAAMYAFEAWGWRVTLGEAGRHVGFGRLFAIRSAGEVVNMTTPMAYVGGEPLKAYLLKDHGVPMVDGLASVVTAKTTMTLAEILFILLGIALWFAAGPGGASSTFPATAAAVTIALLLFGTGVFIAVQRRGLFTGLLGVLRAVGLRLGFLEAREAQLEALDRTILEFYSRDPRRFAASTGWFFLGWLAEAAEVYAILYYLHGPPAAAVAVAIAALSVLIKGATFFIPASVGAQEGGNLVLLVAQGYTELTGITFALLRRLRELVWIAIGLVCLAAVRAAIPRNHIQ
jgi:glycosyltransferase 2 family protein